MVRIAALHIAYDEEEVETHCWTQQTDLHFEQGYIQDIGGR
jgi:hypothetical protein